LPPRSLAHGFSSHLTVAASRQSAAFFPFIIFFKWRLSPESRYGARRSRRFTIRIEHTLKFFHGFRYRPLKRAAKYGENIFFATSQVSDSLFAVNSTQINL
jgi:hypothetical protein